ncbi:MAG: competence/damage-inducible protein A, partial [Chloroflexi bacterium]|nr:competence/damage-inducible protein A [Chloroflexota bacterium]
MHAEIVSIGTEILMGEIVDTNSAYMAAELAKLGVELRWVSKVGDNPERLFDVIDRAWRRSDITITSGGLGPTSDDLTRETIAKVMGEEMEVQDDLLEQLKSMFAGRGSSMPSTNIKQATLIPSAETIPNPMGTAPGWWVEKEGHIIVSTPGPPRELERMWTYEIAPKIKERNPGVAIVTRTL